MAGKLPWQLLEIRCTPGNDLGWDGCRETIGDAIKRPGDGGLYRPPKIPGTAFCMATVNGLNRSVIMELVVINEGKKMKRPTMRRGYESRTPCTI